MSKEDKYEQLRQVCLSYRNEVEELREKLHKCMPYEDAQEFEDFIRNSEKEKYNQQISDLEAKLAEKEVEDYQKLINDICNKHRVGSLKDLDEMYQATKESLYASREYLEELKSTKWKLEKELSLARNEINTLKQQLAEKDRQLKVMRELKNRHFNYYKTCETECSQLKQQLAEKEGQVKQLKLDLGMYKSTNEFINRYGIEKAREVLLQSEKTKNQDKISFAVEKLEKVRKEFDCEDNYCYGDNNIIICVNKKIFNKTIDNQIEEIKKEMK